MNLISSRETWRLASVAAAAAVILSGCATPSEPEPKPAPPAVVEAPKPEAPAEPQLSPAQAKTEAQRLALVAIDLLQNGNEADARTALEKATTLDPANALARKLLAQVNADAQAELGATFFQYKVQRDDTLSKLAQTYLGDRFRFYILAKYNGIAVPGKLAAGQVIKIPGKSAPAAGAPQPAAPAPMAPTTGSPAATPPTAESPATTAPAAETPAATAPAAEAPAAAPAAESVPAAEPAPPQAAEVPQKKSVADLLQEGAEQQRSGNLEGAYATFSEAAREDPGNRDAILQRDAARVALVRRYDREATQAYRRQNLELAIKKWEQILAIDPDNQKATLERARALDLQKKMSEKFGTTPKK